MSTARHDIEALGLKPNKALGQNFLIDEGAIQRITAAAAEPRLPLLEVGPGLGALTLPLAESGLPLAAVELDARLAELLRERLSVYPNVKVVTGDFLKTDIEPLFTQDAAGITAVGNLPYYVTSPICERLVLLKLPVKRMVLMMQQEAAERFFARPGSKNYGPLTVLANTRFNISHLLDLGPGAYYPQPEVSSCVLRFDASGAEIPALLPRLLKCAFAMRRKTLYNNLPAMGISKENAAELISRMGLPASVRAEALNKEDFIRLAELAAEL